MKKTLQECKEIVVKESNLQNIFPTRKDREDLIDLANKMYYEQQSAWVSVEDKKPSDFEKIIYFDKKDGNINVGFFVWSNPDITYTITHWQQLPNPPQK